MRMTCEEWFAQLRETVAASAASAPGAGIARSGDSGRIRRRKSAVDGLCWPITGRAGVRHRPLGRITLEGT